MENLGDMKKFINWLIEKHGADTKLVIAGFNPSATLSATEETTEQGEKVILIEEIL